MFTQSSKEDKYEKNAQITQIEQQFKIRKGRTQQNTVQSPLYPTSSTVQNQRSLNVVDTDLRKSQRSTPPKITNLFIHQENERERRGTAKQLANYRHIAIPPNYPKQKQ